MSTCPPVMSPVFCLPVKLPVAIGHLTCLPDLRQWISSHLSSLPVMSPVAMEVTLLVFSLPAVSPQQACLPVL